MLDTHALIWAASDTSKLTRQTLTALAAPENQVFVSAASIWEISVRQALGHLEFPVDSFDAFAASMGFDILPIHGAHAIAAGQLPMHHRDPFDRMLVAQALIEDLILVSNDRQIMRYDVAVLGKANHSSLD